MTSKTAKVPIYSTIAANYAIAVAESIAAGFSGSLAMISEGRH